MEAVFHEYFELATVGDMYVVANLLADHASILRKCTTSMNLCELACQTDLMNMKFVRTYPARACEIGWVHLCKASQFRNVSLFAVPCRPPVPL
jgi:hypothetical protein